MKKQLVVLGALLAAVMAIATVAQAGTPVAGSARLFIASATTGGTLQSTFGIKLRPAADPDGPGADVTRINWTGALPQSTWKIATTVLKATWSVTDANGGVTIYTDNTNGAAVPSFTVPLPGDPHNIANDPAGILKGTAGTTSQRLPMAWAIKGSSAVVDGSGPTGIRIGDPNGAGADDKQWAYFTDKGGVGYDANGDGWSPTGLPGNPDTYAFSYANNTVVNYMSMIRSNGIHAAQSPDFNSGYFADTAPAYVYIQADFSASAAQTTYTTNRVTVEAYLQ